MFRCGDQVVYGIHGVCKIIEIETKRLGKQSAEYYVLQPIDESNTRYFVPTQNEAATAKLHPLLTHDELKDMLRSPQLRDDNWIEDENKRKQLYRSLITGGDRAALLRMVHAIHNRKTQQLAAGRRLHSCDENFLRDAEKLLGAEFALVLNIDHNEVGEYVQGIIASEKAKTTL